MNYAIRLTYKISEVSELFRDLKDDAKAIVVYEHNDGTRPHIHAYVEEMNITPQTLKNRLVRLLGFKPAKTDWSFKSGADRKFITYMSKGNLNPVFYIGIEGAEIDGYRSQWIERKKAEPSKKSATLTTWDMAVQLAEYMDSEAKLVEVQDHSSYTIVDGKLRPTGKKHVWYEVSPDKMIDKAIQIHIQNHRTFTDFSILRVIHTAYGLSSRERWKKQIHSQIYEKLFPTPRV